MKIFQITFSFLDPSKAVGNVIAESAEEAIEKIKNDIATHTPGISDIEILDVQEILETSHDAKDLDPERSLN